MELNFNKRVLEYSSLKDFLNDYLLFRKRNTKGYTLRRFANELKLKDSSSINKVIKGQRKPGPTMTEQLCEYFAFSDSQEQHFRNLIRLDRFQKQNGKNRSNLKVKNNFIRLLDKAESDRITHWKYFVIRELSKLVQPPATPATIQDTMLFSLAKSEIKEALQVLSDLSLIDWKDGQYLRPISDRFHTMTDTTNEALRRYHEGILNLALLAIRKIPTHQRYLSASTIAVPDHAYEKAKILIEKFQDDMTALCEEHKGEQVYQLAIQFFPLTKSDKH